MRSVVWKPFIGWGPREIAILIVVTAVNSVLVISFGPLSYGPMQFRVGEIVAFPMMVIFGYAGAFGILLSSLITSWVIPGTIAEMLWNWAMFVFWGAITVEMIKRLGRTNFGYQVTALYNAICTGIWVSAMLHFVWEVPFLPTVIWITIAEIITMNGFGYILYKGVTTRASDIIPEL